MTAVLLCKNIHPYLKKNQSRLAMVQAWSLQVRCVSVIMITTHTKSKQSQERRLLTGMHRPFGRSPLAKARECGGEP